MPAFSQVGKKLGAVKAAHGQQLVIVYAWLSITRGAALSSPSVSYTYSHTHMHANTFYFIPLSSLYSLCLSNLSTPLALRCVCRQTVPKWLPLSPLVCVVWLVPPSLLDWTLGAKTGHRRRKVCVHRVWIHASHRRGQDDMNPHWVPSPAGWQGRV